MNSFYRDFAKGLRLTLVVTLLFTAALLQAESVADLPAKPTDYVSDFANVLSPAAVARIDHICSELDHSQANAQIAVVTVKTLDGEDSADWANELENKWHMGKKGTDRGLLILLAVQDHKRRIDVGYGLEGILNDAKVGDIGREMVPYLRQNDFDDAVLLAVKQVGTVIADDAKVSLQDEDQLPQQPGQRVVRHGNPFGGLVLLIILMVFFGGSWIFRLLFGWGLLSSIFGGGWRGGGWGGGSWGSGGGWGGGGGGGSGGSGFGGFGGGDFGGGGAGGDW